MLSRNEFRAVGGYRGPRHDCNTILRHSPDVDLDEATQQHLLREADETLVRTSSRLQRANFATAGLMEALPISLWKPRYSIAIAYQSHLLGQSRPRSILRTVKAISRNRLGHSRNPRNECLKTQTYQSLLQSRPPPGCNKSLAMNKRLAKKTDRKASYPTLEESEITLRRKNSYNYALVYCPAGNRSWGTARQMTSCISPSPAAPKRSSPHHDLGVTKKAGRSPYGPQKTQSPLTKNFSFRRTLGPPIAISPVWIYVATTIHALGYARHPHKKIKPKNAPQKRRQRPHRPKQQPEHNRAVTNEVEEFVVCAHWYGKTRCRTTALLRGAQCHTKYLRVARMT